MVEFKIDGMTCGSCAGRISKAIRELDPAAKMDVDLANRLVRVESASGPEELAAAIADAGYAAQRSHAA